MLRFINFARDAYSWTRWNTPTGSSDPVSNITVATLNDIFVDCAVTNWNQLDPAAGPNPIVVYTALAGSDARSQWDSFLGGNTSNCIPAQFKDGSLANGERVVRANDMEPVESAPNHPGAADQGSSIYFMSTGLHAVDPVAAGSSLIGQVNGVTANETTVANGTFPLSRSVYNVIRQSGTAPVASGAVRRFLGMITPTATNAQSVGWICKGEQWHSEPVSYPSPVGIEDATATKDWFEEKQEAFTESGAYQLAPDAFGHRCNFTDVPVI